MLLRNPCLTSVIVTLGLVLTACQRPASDGACTTGDVQLLNEGTLTVGMDFDYPPFAFDDSKGRSTGFEVDLVRAIAKDAGLKLLLVNRTSAALLPGLLAHRQDIAASGLRDSNELKEETCASVPYLTADLALLAPAPDPHSIGDIGDLQGRSVGVLEGGRGAEWAEEHLEASTIKTLPATDDLLSSLRERTVDAVLDDLVIGRFAQKRAEDIRVVDTIRTGERYVLAAHPENGALVAVVNAALSKMNRNGDLGDLEEKWFGG
ncbi:MAG: ABC transporter substrate-binding protein [Actinomycetota bacterium]